MSAFIFINTLALLIASLIFVKNIITLKNRDIIIDSIYQYRVNCIINSEIPKVDYDDMEDFYKTLFRLYDWGYTRILPKEKYEIIKESIDINEYSYK